MDTFRTFRYEIHNPKIKTKKGIRFAFLTDLHGNVFGEKNSFLLKKIREYDPDGILLTGDMVVRMEPDTLEIARRFLEELVKEYPVFYSMGNHESKMKQNGFLYQKEYLNYEESLKEKGIVILCNEKQKIQLKEDTFLINGLELPLEYYKKPFSPRLTQRKMEELMGRPDPELINVLLAHNPKYGDIYFNWGADLILSGHYHGGVVRFSRHVGALSSQFIPFPRYCCGDFYRKEKCMVVSAGLGEHTVPIRIHNPRELVFLDMKP